ncbi:MAG: hypothetical protein OJF48_002176 [Afipia sp.]|nr:MAG: hypothetical protein OJF48_002176 [Afipia sp.]
MQALQHLNKGFLAWHFSDAFRKLSIAVLWSRLPTKLQ